MHHPRRQNVTTSMVGLKNGHKHKHLTRNAEPHRYSWGAQKKNHVPCNMMHLAQGNAVPPGDDVKDKTMILTAADSSIS